ncbi:MAG: type II secretion system protein [Candidatus Bruticola sp.]
MMHRVSSRKGFTLIELMIVIAIIAILAAILVPNFIRARAQGQVTSCKSNLKNIGTACEMYATDNGGRYPQDLNKLTVSAQGQQPYLKQIPKCPSTGTSDPYNSYTSSMNPDVYTIFCQGSNHTAAGCEADYPKFTATQGLIENQAADPDKNGG